MNTKTIHPSGPKSYQFLNNIYHLAGSQRLKWLQSLTDKYGDVAKFQLLKRDVYIVNHPDLVREILTAKTAIYTKKTVAFKAVKYVLGESTFTATGGVWKRKRQLAQPSFHKTRISNLATIMTDTIGEMLENWTVKCDRGESINLTDAMMRLTLNVVVKALFSTALSKAEVETVANVFTPILEETNRRISFPIKWLYQLPTTKNKNYEENIELLNNIIFRIIKERRANEEQPLDLLQMLLDAREEGTDEPLDDLELRDEIMTIFIAGHETTANAMSWLFIILSQQPAIRQKVETEVAAVLGDRTPTAADFPQLPYALKVFKETMRLYPPVPILPRKVEQDDMLGDYLIKANNEIFFSPYLLHRHPDFWENAETFDPERFEKEAMRQQHPFAYLPFGGGPRICLGNNFAMMEAVFILSMVTQKFRLNLESTADIEPLVSLTIRPKDKVMMILERR